jgi:hypothetical protein
MILRWLRDRLTGRKLQTELAANRAAAEALDRAVREMFIR